MDRWLAAPALNAAKPARSGWRGKLAFAAKATLGLVLLLLVWGVVIEPRIVDVEREVAFVPGIPASWEGGQLAVVGDFQVGMWLDNENTVRAAVREIVAARPRTVLLTGDFIYAQEGEPATKVKELQPLLAPLVDAGIPAYAVLGNHDYGQDTPDQAPVPARAALVREGLEAIGIRVLMNEAVALPGRREEEPPLYLVGVGPHWPGLAAPAAALRQVPDGAPRFVFMHNPLSFRDIPAHAAPAAVAAHTHGGQLRIPFAPRFSWLTLVKGAEVVDGWAEPGYGAPGNRLYVNRGIGFSTLPIRINCPPELTLFTLRRPDPSR